MPTTVWKMSRLATTWLRVTGGTGIGAMQIAVLGIDLGKNSRSAVGLDSSGGTVLVRRLSRDGVVQLALELPGCVVATEACCGAHHLGRKVRGQGHQTRQRSPAQDADPRRPCGPAHAVQGRNARGRWLRGLAARAHRNTVVVALVAKLARIVRALLRSVKRFEMRPAVAS